MDRLVGFHMPVLAGAFVRAVDHVKNDTTVMQVTERCRSIWSISHVGTPLLSLSTELASVGGEL